MDLPGSLPPSSDSPEPTTYATERDFVGFKRFSNSEQRSLRNRLERLEKEHAGLLAALRQYLEAQARRQQTGEPNA